MTKIADLEALKKELSLLFRYLQKVKQELAAIRSPNPDKDPFGNISDQLDAVVGATEEATHTILASVEEIGEIAVGLKDQVKDGAAQRLFDRLDEKVAAIFEACAFQDVTGQRITKIVRSMTFVDDRVSAMASLWGADSLADVALPEPDGEGLQGPALPGEGVSQADIDKMFE